MTPSNNGMGMGIDQGKLSDFIMQLENKFRKLKYTENKKLQMYLILQVFQSQEIQTYLLS